MYNARTFDSFIEIVLDGKHSINDIVKQNPQYSTYVEHGLFAGHDIIHKEVFSIDHSFRNETGSIDSECIKCICDFIFEIVMKHIPFDGGRA